MYDSLNEECPQRLTYLKAWSPDDGAGWRGDSALLEEEVHHWGGLWEPIALRYFQFTLSASHWGWRCDHSAPCTSLLLFGLPSKSPSGTKSQRKKIPSKVKEKKIPSSFYKLLWPWCVGTATGKQARQGVEQSSGCTRPSQHFDVDCGYVVWGVVLGIRRLIHSCWKSHIQIIESGKHHVLSCHLPKTWMHWTLRLPAVSFVLKYSGIQLSSSFCPNWGFPWGLFLVVVLTSLRL